MSARRTPIDRVRPRLLAAVVVGSIIAAHAVVASADGGRRPLLSVRASITVPSGRNPAASSAARCAWEMDGEHSQGVTGFVIPLPKGVLDHQRFSLRALDRPLTTVSAGDVWIGGPAFDIAFYGAGRGCDTQRALSTRSMYGGHVWGLVPAGARYAVIVRVGAVVEPRTIGSCYMMPPICGPLTRPARMGVHASHAPVSERFLFTVHRRP